jgi:leucyl aminopeptidase (aminopeptidase T)
VRAGSEEAVARAVLTGYLGVRPRESVTIEAWSHALPWARAFVLEARRLKAEPLLALEDEETLFQSLVARPPRRVPVSPIALAGATDALVYLRGPDAFPRLFGIRPAERHALLDRHSVPWKRFARGQRMRVARLSVAEATPTAAARYGVDLDSWRSELVAASSVLPRRLTSLARRYSGPLLRARRLTIRHANGTALTAQIAPAGIRIDDGRSARGPPDYATDVPTGRIVILLRPGSADGRWEANRALFDRFAEDPVQQGAQFRIQRGRVREFSFDRGGESFAAAYATGGRGRADVAAVVIGVNPKVSRAPELGELAAGATSLVIGGIEPLGGRGLAEFSRTTSLLGAEIELDAQPWIAGGRRIG